jgi:methylenetetrahydrofolate dehydrogenase (NADP+)/methenyltetrahydrofolate cyclohydrolase
MELLKGKPVSEHIDSIVRGMSEGEELRLSVILTGDDPSSRIYSRSKVAKGRKLGAEVQVHEFPEGTEEEVVMAKLREDAEDPGINGIMIERPLARGLNLDNLMREIPPSKDVEGAHPENLGRLVSGNPIFIPPTPLGALLLMRHHSIDTEGRRALVLGRSINVGRPMSLLLSLKGAAGNSTVTLAHSRTRDVHKLTLESEIVISATGRAGSITGEMVKDGAVLIDLGINPLSDGSITGDVDIPSMEGREVKVTPTPGGTGPVTVSSMFLNLAMSLNRSRGVSSDELDPMISEIYR